MIAQTEICSDRERILALLAAHRSDACVRQLFADLDEIERLMEYYSFRTPQLADRFIEKLESRYRYEIFAIYGSVCSFSRFKNRRRNSKIQKFSHSFICGKSYSPPAGENSFLSTL